MIPKVIHYIWLGGKPLPKIAKKCIKTWKKFCPDYQIKRWDESNLNIDIFPYVRQAYDAKKFAFASDVLRYKILYDEGGIYLDIDVKLIKNLDEFLNNKLFFGFENEKYVAPGLILGGEKDNKHLKSLLDAYKDEKFVGDDGSYNLKTVCMYATEYLEKKGMQFEDKIQNFDGVTVYPVEYFNPYNLPNRECTKNTHSIHLYYGSWFTKKQRAALKLKNFARKILGEKLYNKIKNKMRKK